MTLTRIIAHYSECDNPEGGMWDAHLENSDYRRAIPCGCPYGIADV